MLKKSENKSGLTDMTVGNPLKLITLFSLPLLAGNVLQQLYNMVDSMVVGQYVGTQALAAVGTGFPIFFMVSSLFMGIGMGSTVIISQYYGGGDMDHVRQTVDTIYTAMLVGCIPLTLFGLFISEPLLNLIHVPADTFELSHIYLLITFCGVMPVFGYNINAGILQGLGDSKSPLIFLSIACVINIILDLVFVIGFGWGVAGVAIATVIAQSFSWIFGIFYINHKYPEIKIHPFRFRFDKRMFLQMFRIGLPIGIQQAIFSVGTMALQSLINGYGSVFMAGFNGANKLDTFVFMPITSFASACTTFVGQNIGAGKLDRVKEGTHSAIKLSVVVSILSGGLLLILGRQLMGMFDPSPDVIAAGMAYLVRIVPFYWMLAILFTMNSVMRGAGETIVPMVSSIISLWLARVPAAYILNALFGRDNMYYCYFIGWILGLIITCYAYFKGDWRNKGIVLESGSGAVAQ